MLYPGPTRGFAELFPSPAKGHDPGLSDEQSAEAQALVSTQVTQLQTQTTAALATKADAAPTTAALATKADAAATTTALNERAKTTDVNAAINT